MLRSKTRQSLLLQANEPRSAPSSVLMTLAGVPTATEKSGMSRVTTDPAPIVHPLPMVIPALSHQI